MGVYQEFPAKEIIRFYGRSRVAVTNAARNSRRLMKFSKLDAIEDFLFNAFKDQAVLHLYGSRHSGNAIRFSDVDISICYLGNKSRKQLFSILETKIKQDQDWKFIVTITNTPVPVLRCIYIPKQIMCEIAISNHLGIATSNMVRHLFQIQPQSVKFFHFIRIWTDICGLKFKHYQLTLLIIFFLQQVNIMPSIETVQRKLQPELIGIWNVEFDSDRTIWDYRCKRMRNFKDYLTAFFEFYATFQFDRYVVYPNSGKAVRKKNYPFETNNPPTKRTHNWEMPMAMASLITMDYNVTYDVGRDRLNQFINNCRLSMKLFQNNDW